MVIFLSSFPFSGSSIVREITGMRGTRNSNDDNNAGEEAMSRPNMYFLESEEQGPEIRANTLSSEKEVCENGKPHTAFVSSFSSRLAALKRCWAEENFSETGHFSFMIVCRFAFLASVPVRWEPWA